MTLIVTKFGGTSVRDADRIRNAARVVAEEVEQGHQVVVVVSAMAGETNRLTELAATVTTVDDADARREKDALLSTGEQVSAALFALALRAHGVRARSLNGRQMVLRTDGRFGNARIRSIDDALVRGHLDDGQVVVVTGFQGIDDQGDVVTLGRGGSDTSAVAMAAALAADTCIIYTDVDGIYTADPRICTAARRLERIAAEEMLELAAEGAKVLQHRSVELAMKHGVHLVVKRSFGEPGGTTIVPNLSDLEALKVTAVVSDGGQAQVGILGVENRADMLAVLLAPLARDDISIDLITHSVGMDGRATLNFSLDSARLPESLSSIESAAQSLGAQRIQVLDEACKISVVGIGMRTRAGVAQRVFSLLSEHNIPIHLGISTEIKVSCLVPADCEHDAVRILHEGFGLHHMVAAAAANAATTA